MAQEYIKTANTLALWHMEDLTDASGNGKTLTNYNSVAFSPGLFGLAADFGTANTNKDFSASISIPNTTPTTYVFWIKMRTEIGSGTQTFFGMANTGVGEVSLEYQYNSGTRRFHIDNYANNYYGNATLGTNNWHCVVVVKKTSNSTISCYLDGTILIAEQAVGTTTDVDSGFAIGSNYARSGNFLSAYIDDFFIENREWSAAEISAFYLNNSKFFRMF